MKLFGLWFVFFLVIVTLPAWSTPLDIENVNAAAFDSKTGKTPAVILKVQVLLDRQGYSPGVIDGRFGDATGIALKAFQADNELEATGHLDEPTFAKLVEADAEPVLTLHEIETADVSGPFEQTIPDNIADMAKLKRMAFTGPQEGIAERFHMGEDLLKRLNPDADFGQAGSEIIVTAVETQKEGRDAAGGGKAHRIVVDKKERTLRVFGKDDRLIALYPATIGSEQTPAPDGETKITRVARGPSWNYDPELELVGHKDRPDERMIVRAGPNNPVGTVWIALNRDHYGIHGTADPEKVGKNISSGCVRLTNWDVEELAGLVRRGTPVLFEN